MYTTETICVPPMSSVDVKQGDPGYFKRKKGNYSLLDKNGIIRKGIHIKKGDFIIGKIITNTSKTGVETITDCSMCIKHGEEGIVDKVCVTYTPNGYKMVKITIRQVRIPEIGDKFASRAAQKGTCGATYRQEDMPFNAEGICPDIIINPHCLSGDTIIEMSDGDVEYIKDIIHKDHSITTINPETLEKTSTKYNNGFVKNVDKCLKKIVTTSGRIIKCTQEHLLLIVRNNITSWIKADQLIPYSDKVIVTHSIIPVSNTDGNSLTIVKGDSVYWNRLVELGFVGDISIQKTKILARLVGAIDSDGHLQIRNIKTDQVRCMLHVGEIGDYEEVCNDMRILGFKKPSVLKTAHCYIVELEVALGVLMKYLGCCTGNKTQMERVFPVWIKNMPSSVKREFLSGYHGGDGSKVVVNYKTTQQQTRIRGTRCRTMNNVKDSHIEYLKCMMELFDEFGIKTTLQKYSTKYDDRTDLMIAFSTSQQNINKISEIIAYRYCNHKRRESVIAIEYIKTRINGIHFTYEKFKECFMYNNNILSFVESVTDIPPEPVYDFTTVSDNHSFIANGIVSHNCIPSRMTVNQLMECVLGKACAIGGTYGDATPFSSSSSDKAAERICELLASAGMKQNNAYDRTGWETMYNGMTGEQVKSKVFMGPTYYQRLKHMVADKMHARSRGHVTSLCRQPLEGRSRDGGEILTPQWYLIVLLVYTQ